MTLEPAMETEAARSPWRRHKAGMVCLGFGLISLLVAVVFVFLQDSFFGATTEPRVTVPLFAAAIIAGVAAGVRKERSVPHVVGGIAMAGAALALPWVLLLAAVAGGALFVMFLVSELL